MATRGATRPSEEAHRPETTVRLARDLTLADATLLGIGAIMGGGIFVLPGIAAGVAGPGLVMALVLNAFVTIPTLLVYAELASGVHDAGGGYLWVRDAFGQGWGFLGGWMSWFSHAVACAVYSLASASYLIWLLERYDLVPASFEGGVLVKLAAVGITTLFVFLNYVGVKKAARAENFVTVVVLGTLAAFLIFGFLAIGRHPEGLGQLHLGDAGAMLPNGFLGVFLAMGLMFIAFEGYEVVAQASEEVKRPKRNVPLACILSIVIMSPLLVMVAVVALAAIQVPGDSWVWLADHKELALVEAAGQFVPFGIGAVLILFGAMLSNVTALNSTIYSSSRVSFAMGRDRELPAVFAKVHPRTHTPAASILLSGLLIAVMAAALPIQDVAAAADMMFLLLFTLVNASYIKLRRTKRDVDFGFRAPFFPWLPLFGLVTKFALGVALFLYSPIAAAVGVAWVAVGAAVNHAYVKRHGPAPEPRSSVAFEVETAQRKGYHIVLPVANPASAGPLAGIARDLARAKG
ncbi:MAG TPA: amino acid permease, partial [Candidatus Thermoplasmatota archaeon]|nr:amino acid permease [Candidatus Thermoplasmatota archaeon]